MKYRVKETIIWFVEAETSKNAIELCQDGKGHHQNTEWKVKKRIIFNGG
jgi:hypothetical protein